MSCSLESLPACTALSQAKSPGMDSDQKGSSHRSCSFVKRPNVPSIVEQDHACGSRSFENMPGADGPPSQRGSFVQERPQRDVPSESPPGQSDSLPGVVDDMYPLDGSSRRDGDHSSSSLEEGLRICTAPVIPASALDSEEEESERGHTDPLHLHEARRLVNMSPRRSDGQSVVKKLSFSDGPPMRHVWSGSGLAGPGQGMPMRQTRSSFAQPSKARHGLPARHVRSSLEMVKESDSERPVGRVQSAFSRLVPGGGQHGRLRSFLAIVGGAEDAPRGSDQVPAAASSLSILGASFLRMVTIQTRGLTKTVAKPDAPQLQGGQQANGLACRLWNAAPAVTHALVLSAACLSSFFMPTPPDLSSATGVALLAVYVVEFLVLISMASAQAFHPEAQRKLPPMLTAMFHLALLGLEAHSRGASWQAWSDATFRVTALQSVAMGLHSASTLAWLATWVLFASGMALVVALSKSLVPSELAQVLVLPLAATLSLAVTAGRDLEGGISCRQGFMEACLGAPCRWESLYSALPVPDARVPVTKASLHERLSSAIAKLQAAPLPPTMSHAICSLLKAVVEQVDALHCESLTLHEQLNLDNAPPAVQEYVMGLIQSQSYDLPEVDEVHSEFGEAVGLKPSQMSVGQLSFSDQVQSLMQPLLAREAKELGKPSASPEAMQEATHRLGLWDFDLSALSTLCGCKPLAIVGQVALRPLVAQFNLDKKKTQSFLTNLEAHYFSSNPYHNSVHAADVLNSIAYFQNLKTGPMASLRPLERLAGCLAAAAHDVGHDGFNNRFHTGAETPLGRLFNDQSPLENLHSAITFALLHSAGTNFLAPISGAEWATFRQMVVQMILDTDMGKHFQAMTAFKKEFLEGDQKEAEDSAKRRQVLLSFVLKACDIGASAKPFAIHAVWASRITAEFFRQGDQERQLGLSISPLCDRRTKNIGESQVGFYDFIVLPLYQALNEHLHSCRVKEEMLAQAAQNREFWKHYDSSKFDYEAPESNAPALVAFFGDHLVVPFARVSSGSSKRSH